MWDSAADGRVFTANADGTVRVWNRPNRRDAAERNGRVFAPSQAEAILSVGFGPKDKSIALGTRTGIVYVYELDRPDQPKSFRCEYAKERRHPVMEVRFSTDGKRIMARDQMLNTFVFDTSASSQPLVTKDGRRPQGVADDGRTALFKSRPPTSFVIGTLDPTIDAPIAPKLNPHGGMATLTDETENWFLFRAARVAFSPDRSLVAILNDEGMIQLFRTATGERAVRAAEAHSE